MTVNKLSPAQWRRLGEELGCVTNASRSECPECGGAMKGDTCEDCGYEAPTRNAADFQGRHLDSGQYLHTGGRAGTKQVHAAAQGGHADLIAGQPADKDGRGTAEVAPTGGHGVEADEPDDHTWDALLEGAEDMKKHGAQTPTGNALPPFVKTATKKASIASIRAGSKQPLEHAEAAHTAVGAGNSPVADHLQAAAAHDDIAEQFKTGGEPGKAESHADAAALHRKAAELHRVHNGGAMHAENYSPDQARDDKGKFDSGGGSGGRSSSGGSSAAEKSDAAYSASTKAGQDKTMASHVAAGAAHYAASHAQAAAGNAPGAAYHRTIAQEHGQEVTSMLARGVSRNKQATNRRGDLPEMTKQQLDALVANCTCGNTRNALLALRNAKTQGSNSDETGNAGFDTSVQAGGEEDSPDKHDEEYEEKVKAQVKGSKGIVTKKGDKDSTANARDSEGHGWDDDSQRAAAAARMTEEGDWEEDPDERPAGNARPAQNRRGTTEQQVRQWLQNTNAPKSVRGIVTNALRAEAQAKGQLVAKLVANVSGDEHKAAYVQFLSAKPLDELRAIYNLARAQPRPQDQDYQVNRGGQAVPNALNALITQPDQPAPLYLGQAAPLGNAAGGAGAGDPELVLETPTINYRRLARANANGNGRVSANARRGDDGEGEEMEDNCD